MSHCQTPRKGTISANGSGWRALQELPCKRWACPDCGPTKAYKLQLRMSMTHAERFITLTHKPIPGETKEEALRDMRHDWHTLHKELNRRQKGDNISYVCIVEWTINGQPHLHILCNCDYLRQRTLSGLWRNIHGAPIVDIRRVKEEEKAAKYLCKYLTKGTEAPARMRRWSSTRGFLPPLPPYINPAWPEDTTYSYDPIPPTTLASWLIDQGWQMLQGPGDTIILISPPEHPPPEPSNPGSAPFASSQSEPGFDYDNWIQERTRQATRSGQ